MNSFFLVLCSVIVIIAFIGANIGFKFHKWRGWLFVLLGFCGGLLFPLCLPPENINRNPYSALLFAFVISFFIFGYGWAQRKNHEKAKAIWNNLFEDKNE